MGRLLVICDRLLRWQSLAVLYVLVFIAYQGHSFLHVPPSPNAKPQIVYIQPKTRFRAIAELLQDKGIIRSRLWFTVLAEVTGSVDKIKAGEYELSASMLPSQILNKLARGDFIAHMVTIPEGYNVYQIADVLEEARLVTREEFLSKVFDQTLLASYGFAGPSFEGYLFPDTYAWWRNMKAQDIVHKMATRFKRLYSQKYERQAKKQGLSMREVVTLASIVEKESGRPEERPLIAAVFRNRLHRRMRLQADPTVIYGLRNFNGDLTKSDLQKATAYNTYVVDGLPPGPIACPGESAIRAVLNPKGKYLYFVSRNDGSHYFSRTLAEHNRAVAMYQKAQRDSAPSFSAVAHQ